MITTELRILQSVRATTHTYHWVTSRFPSHFSLKIFNGSRIWVRTHIFVNLRMRIRHETVTTFYVFPTLEHAEVLEDSRDLIFWYTCDRLCNVGTGKTTVSNLVHLPFRIQGKDTRVLLNIRLIWLWTMTVVRVTTFHGFGQGHNVYWLQF
jgi:hypothetical protein